MDEKKQVIIQQRINEVMSEEFNKLIVESSKDPLLTLICENRLYSMSLEEIKKYLLSDVNA